MVQLVPSYRVCLQRPEPESLPATLHRSSLERLQSSATQAVMLHILTTLHLCERSTITESVCCTPETNVTLATNYAAIKAGKEVGK